VIRVASMLHSVAMHAKSQSSLVRGRSAWVYENLLIACASWHCMRDDSLLHNLSIWRKFDAREMEMMCSMEAGSVYMM
jgi:hypothetical protein